MNSSKLTYLRGFLTEYAFKCFSHLSITDDNYQITIDLLKAEFLDVPYIIDETLNKLINNSPKFDIIHNAARVYINESRAL